MAPVKTLITKVMDVSKYIAGISAIVVVMFGGFKFIDNVSEQTRVICSVQDKLISIQDSIAALSCRVDDINLQMEGINDNTVLIGNYVENVNTYVKGVNKAFNYHIQTSPEVSKADWAKMMDLIERSIITNQEMVESELPDPKISVRKIKY